MKDFKLDNQPKITSGFIIPEGYFNAFSNRILEQLPKQEKKTLSIFSLRKTWYFAAAAFLILLLSIALHNEFSNKIEEVDSTTLENYLANQSTISEDEIVELLEKEDVEKMKVDFNIKNNDIEDILKSNTNLEQYIID
ncbi:hypothetical protein [Flavobacterium sp.]|uniref:hypothetical protein n=1 Tax=Flavobacterium sp. TaxID=239 RepID=UPI0025CDE904|nr:hypothetical protein [Flavobacterium sp.]